MHHSSYDLCRNFVEDSLSDKKTLSIADVGSKDVNGSYRPLFDREGWHYVGLDDAAGKNVDVVLTPKTWKENANKFDVAISGQCLEHVLRPWKWIDDVASIVKPGGLVWIIAPNTFQFHEYPRDCWRIWPDGLRAIFEEGKLETIYCRRVGIDTFGLAKKPLEK